jgi:hypothetical protein
MKQSRKRKKSDEKLRKKKRKKKSNLNHGACSRWWNVSVVCRGGSAPRGRSPGTLPKT